MDIDQQAAARRHRLDHPGALYWQRVRDSYRFQYKALTSVVDLTILLYIVIPGLLLAARLYYGLWTDPVAAWMTRLPLGSLMSLWLLLTTLRGLTLRLEAADLLFLHARRSWMRGIKGRAILGSIAYAAILSAFGGLLLAPMLVRGLQLNSGSLGTLAVVIFLFRVNHMLLLHFCRIKWSGWRSTVLQLLSHALIFALLQAAVQGSLRDIRLAAAAIAVLAVISLFLVFLRMKLKGTFYADIEEEMKQKLRLSAFLLSSAVDKPKRHRSKSWLLRRSSRLLPFSGKESVRLAELIVKSTVRNMNTLRMLLIYTAAGTVSLQFPPSPVNLFVFAGLIMLLAYWLNGMRRAFMESRLLELLPVPESLAFQAAGPAMRLLLLIPVIFFVLSLSWSIWHTWWALAAGLPAGILFNWWLGGWIWKLFGGWRKKSLSR
ncbi:ABC transporter permease [Paenibacillus physcomitrellae]|uniref:ABC transporter permease n=1 Tax=Paenibacillus physcomitrellae TaxID=1619311 RepID=A0ABQ1G021_9BACL|nr:ABC transporter permease [Paenibacillus physcomitrellae]GGA32675.1 hypothetical protein GCM10010917_17250 [Paenibacillus physcomitrellae]